MKMIILVTLTFFASPLFAFVVKSDELTSRYGITYQECWSRTVSDT